jgi:hypothetical protein
MDIVWDSQIAIGEVSLLGADARFQAQIHNQQSTIINPSRK